MTKIQIRRDTAANWTAANPILASGELALEVDTRKRKTGDGATAWIALAYDASASNRSRTLAPAWMQNFNQIAIGHSFVGVGWPELLRQRCNAPYMITKSEGGTGMAVAAKNALTNINVGGRQFGITYLQCIRNDATFYLLDAARQAEFKGGLRAALRHITADYGQRHTDVCFVFTGTWATATDGLAWGGDLRTTNAIGDRFDVAWIGDTATLQLVAPGTTGGGVLTILKSDGTTYGTVDTRGCQVRTPFAFDLVGFGTGAHTVRCTFTAGTSMTVNGIQEPNLINPTTVMLVKEGPETFDPTTATRMLTYFAWANALIAEIGAALPAGTIVTNADTGPAGWTPATVTAEGLHPNALGNEILVSDIILQFESLGWRDGQNYLTLRSGSGKPAYTIPTPNYGGPGDNIAPTVPGTPTATAGSGSVSLAFAASTDNVGVVGYRVYSSVDGYVAVAATGTASPITVTSANGTAVSFQVAAYDAAANQSAKSAASNSVTPVATPDTTPPTTPGTPTATAGAGSATATTSGSTDNVGVVGYRWYRSGTLVSGASPVTATFTDTGLTAGTAVSYTVEAVDAASNVSTRSAASNSVTPTAAPTFTPAADTVAWYKGSGITGVADGALLASWPNSGQGGYGAITTADATANAPLFRATGGPAGTPCVDFRGGALSGPATALNTSLALGTDFAMLWVMKASSANGAFFGGAQSSGVEFLVGSVANKVESYNNPRQAVATYAIGEWMIVEVDQRPAAAGTSTTYKNGTQTATGTATAPTAPTTEFAIGARSGTTTGGTVGSVAEAIVLKGATTAARRKEARDYLAAKYGITAI